MSVWERDSGVLGRKERCILKEKEIEPERRNETKKSREREREGLTEREKERKRWSVREGETEME